MASEPSSDWEVGKRTSLVSSAMTVLTDWASLLKHCEPRHRMYRMSIGAPRRACRSASPVPADDSLMSVPCCRLPAGPGTIPLATTRKLTHEIRPPRPGRPGDPRRARGRHLLRRLVDHAGHRRRIPLL